VDITKPQKKRTTQEQLKNGSGEGNVDRLLQVQLEENGGGSAI